MGAWSISRYGLLLNEGGRCANFTWLFPRSFFLSIRFPSGWLRLIVGPAWAGKAEIARQVWGPVWFSETGGAA